MTVVAGPYFEDLEVGMRVEDAPSLTLTDGLAAAHRAILGVRLRLTLDAGLCEAVTGEPRLLADPQLVCDVAIGQSTPITQRVIANLFYRGLVFHRLPRIGDTLRTTTEVVALRQTSRRSTGLAALRIRTVDQEDRSVLDFHRCALLPLRDPNATTGRADDLAAVGTDELDPGPVISGWRLDGLPPAEVTAGTTWTVASGDVVSSAPELARLSLNIAAAHHHAGEDGRRLVYGGHTIGLAAAQATRALPGLLAVVAWHGCDHLAPVYEGDTLTSRLKLERIEPLAAGRLLHLRSEVHAVRAHDPSETVDVLDWRFVAAAA